MRILVYGAGVIGSLYASKLAKAGFDVTVLARGERLSWLNRNGLLYRFGADFIHKADVKIIDRLEDDDKYNYILLTVRANQAEDALRSLKSNSSKTIVTLVSNPKDYSEWENIVGEGRILPAYPGGGGSIVDGVLDAKLAPMLICPTTFGEISGESTRRSRALAYIFRKSHIPYKMVGDMHGWQLCQLSVAIPLANAYYNSDNPEKVWEDGSVIEMTVMEIRKNLESLNEQGVLLPKQLKHFAMMPNRLNAIVLKMLYRSRFGNLFMFRHAINAPDELKMLEEELKEK